MTEYNRPAGFLESIGKVEPPLFVDEDIYQLVDRLPKYDAEYSDEDGLLSVYRGLVPDYKNDEKVLACTARFLMGVSKEIMSRRPATALHMIESVSVHVPTSDLEKTTATAVKAFQEGGVDGYYRVEAVISYLGRVIKRYADVPWPTDRPEIFYLIALAHEAIEGLRLDGAYQHKELSRSLDDVIKRMRASQPNLVNHFRPLAENPQVALATGVCTPDEAVRRRALGNRFFSIVMERGATVDFLGNNTRCLKNMLQLISDAPTRPDYIQSLSSEYDNPEFREVLALKLLSVIHRRSYLKVESGTDIAASLASFTSLTDDGKQLLQSFSCVPPDAELRERGLSHLMAAVLKACARKDIPQADLDDLIAEMSVSASIEKAYEGAQTSVRSMITDYVIRICPEQASFLSYQDRGQKFISELGV